MNTTPSSRLLLVEGHDELHVVSKLLNRHRVEPSFEIAIKGGFDELHSSIYNEVNAPQRRVLGILVPVLPVSTNSPSFLLYATNKSPRENRRSRSGPKRNFVGCCFEGCEARVHVPGDEVAATLVGGYGSRCLR